MLGEAFEVGLHKPCLNLLFVNASFPHNPILRALSYTKIENLHATKFQKGCFKRHVFQNQWDH